MAAPSSSGLPAGLPTLPGMEHPESRARQVYIGVGFSAAVSTVFLVMRFFTKWKVQRNVFLEDCEC